jgi:glutathione synthase
MGVHRRDGVAEGATTMKVGFAISRAANLTVTWTTVHLVLAALRQGHAVRIVQVADFEVDPSGRMVARAFALEPDSVPTADEFVAALHERSVPRRFVDVSRLDLLMLRCAPLRPELVTFAMMAAARGVQVVNEPQAALLVSHKAWLAALPDVLTPSTLVTHSRAAAHLFYERHPRGVVVKPARGSGGRAVSWVRRGHPVELDAAFGRAATAGDGYVVLQAYLREAEDGEKRILWLDGEVLGGYLRRRAAGEFRHNLKRGAMAEPTTVTDRERAMVGYL